MPGSPAAAGVRGLRLSRRALLSDGGALVAALSALRWRDAPRTGGAARQGARGMSSPIATLDLTGATTNKTGSVSWNLQSVGASWIEIAGSGRPYLELINLSPCMLQITLPLSGSTMPLPPGSWHIFPLDPQETSYNYTVLNAQQNATQNKVLGYYYSAREPAPVTGQVVNQSQALAAVAQGATTTSGAGAGSSSNIITIGPSTIAASFTIASIAVGFFGGGLGGGGGTMGIGRRVTLNVSNGVSNVWNMDMQEREEPYFFPLNLIIANTTPGTSKGLVSLFPSGATNQFSVSNDLSVVGYIS